MHASHPLTVLHVAAPAVAGGLETVVLEMTAGLGRLGHRVVLAAVLAPGWTDHPVLSRAAELGVKVLPIVVPPKAYYRESNLLDGAIAAVRPDVVHTHGYRADLLGGFAARRAGVPWVATAHGFTGGDRKNRVYEWLQVRAYRWAQAVVAVSRPILERLAEEGVDADRMLLLPNAYAPNTLLSRQDARTRIDLPEDAFVIGWVGRLSREKGADVFLDGLAQLRDLPCIASVIGDGAEREALKRQAEQLGVGNRVHWHGALAQASSLFSAFDAFVLSSRTEGTPMALLEAAGAGVPMVATSVGGVPDMFTIEELILVPPERPAELAIALRSILADPAIAHARSVAAFDALGTRFDLESWLGAHVALYRTLRSGRSATE